MLNILGSQTLRSVPVGSLAVERIRFLEFLGKDLPGWLLCYRCSKFHPVDHNGGPHQPWHPFTEKKCVQLNGVVSIGYEYLIRFEYAQLLMRNYQLGRPYERYLEKLSSTFVKCCLETRLECVVTASIVADEIVLKISYTLKLLKRWDIPLIRRSIPQLCPHLGTRFYDNICAQALRCQVRHAESRQGICTRCKGQKHCLVCSTSFQISVTSLEDLVTEVHVDVWRCLGSCERPLSPKWRRQVDCDLPDIEDRRPRR